MIVLFLSVLPYQSNSSDNFRIQFPDATQITNPRRSAVMITGDFYSVIEAKKLLMVSSSRLFNFDK